MRIRPLILALDALCYVVDMTQLYLKQPLCVVFHDDLQLFQPLGRLVVVVHRSILLDGIFVAAALCAAVFLLGQQKRVAAWPVLNLILPLASSTISCP